MTLRELFKRTQLRSAALFTLLFAVGVSALFGVLVQSADEEVDESIRSRVLRTKDALVTIDRRFGFEELVSVVTEEAESVRDADSIFLLLGADGNIQAGNVLTVRPFDDWQVLERSQIPSIAHEGARQDRFFAIWTPVSKGMLLVGRSDREARQLKLLLLQSLGWGLLGTAAAAIGLGVLLARRTQKRLDAIGRTLSAASSGQLHRRIVLSGANDDLDEVAGRINGMLGQLGKLIDNVNQSSTDIAHDLKKPMTRLRQRLEAALETNPESAGIEAVLQRSLDEIDDIVETFDALLNIGQLEAGDRRARFTDVDLAEVMRTVIEAYEAVIQDTGFRLRESFVAAKGANIHGDAELLTQLFANLIENVLRHCPVGTTISVSLSVDPARVTATVADNGPGIPAGERENVFRRFYRLERARSGPGHGLGLNLVAAIADLHGAAIALEDNDPGLRVAITFPRKLG